MDIESINAFWSNSPLGGEFVVSLSVRESGSNFQELEGTGDTLSEALYDLAEQLEVAEL